MPNTGAPSTCPIYLDWFEQAAKEWLFKFEPSELSADILTLLGLVEETLAQPRLPSEDDPIQSMMDIFSSATLSKSQQGEICVRVALWRTQLACGKIPHPLGRDDDCMENFLAAERNLKDAGFYFSHSQHRVATVTWMVGCLRLLQGRGAQGWMALEDSLKIYQQKLQTRRAGLNDEKAKWYTQHIAQLTRYKEDVKNKIVKMRRVDIF